MVTLSLNRTLSSARVQDDTGRSRDSPIKTTIEIIFLKVAIDTKSLSLFIVLKCIFSFKFIKSIKGEQSNNRKVNS